eukprot:2699862-Alexandrium_andersonii.AAC.1
MSQPVHASLITDEKCPVVVLISEFAVPCNTSRDAISKVDLRAVSTEWYTLKAGEAGTPRG